MMLVLESNLFVSQLARRALAKLWLWLRLRRCWGRKRHRSELLATLVGLQKCPSTIYSFALECLLQLVPQRLRLGHTSADSPKGGYVLAPSTPRLAALGVGGVGTLHSRSPGLTHSCRIETAVGQEGTGWAASGFRFSCRRGWQSHGRQLSSSLRNSELVHWVAGLPLRSRNRAGNTRVYPTGNINPWKLHSLFLCGHWHPK
mmetsp:Transcript_41778/g.65257  ORF Transcript_41778/g.65257 Transcript_41778/m.65257 type:complete len:202 (-) Transcript_41778:586-1191(-)